MGKVTIDGKGADVVVRVYKPRAVKAFGIDDYEQVHIDHGGMGKLFLVLREVK